MRRHLVVCLLLLGLGPGRLVGQPLAPDPNPFRTRTTLPFVLDQPAEVSLNVFDVLGRRIWHVRPHRLADGPQTLIWNGTTDEGQAAPAGLYLIRLRIGPTGEILWTQQVIRLP